MSLPAASLNSVGSTARYYLRSSGLRLSPVFCGGQRMRQRRLSLNPNCRFVGTGVDFEHFSHALSPQLPVAAEIAALGKVPILGYFGVIDERIDYALIAKLADAHGDWQIVMVGPTVRVDPAPLPRRANVHWLGARPYSDLPAYTKGFSVCLMPFARNEATEFIHPTKALEYMAAGRPVISTALDEVLLNFGTVAHIAHSHFEFITHCEREVNRVTESRVTTGLAIARKNTWEANGTKMEAPIDAILAPAQPFPRVRGVQAA